MQTPDLEHYTAGRLGREFYERNEVVTIAQELLGKVLVTNFKEELTAARIVETEAYNGALDKASHAYNNRRTNRTEVMFGNGGKAYVYLCYGIHHLFNVVTNVQGTPHAVLIRAVEPIAGIASMLARTGKLKFGYDLTRGPGNVSKALGIQTAHTGLNLLHNEIFIADDGKGIESAAMVATPRIGVDYAAEDALLPYRFIVIGNPYVSGKKGMNVVI
jgi:DNA-3-methyladenine glycosylase